MRAERSRSFVVPCLLVLSAAVLAVPARAFAQDAPKGKDPGADPGAKLAPGAEPKEAPKDDAKKDDADPAAQVAASVDELVAKMKDAKFVQNRLDAAKAATDLQDAKLLPPLIALLKDEHPDVRTAAIQALGNRTYPDQQKKAAEALGARIKHLEEKLDRQPELLEVITSLHDLAQETSIGPLLDGLQDDKDLDVVRARAFAVANVPSPKAIEGLIDQMSRRHRDGSGVPGTLGAALSYATGERKVNDPDQWRAWWKEVEKSFDFAAAADQRAALRKKEDDAAKRRAERDAKRSGGGGKKDDK